jgi:hypothetical protein
MDGTSPAGDQVPLCMRCNHRMSKLAQYSAILNHALARSSTCTPIASTIVSFESPPVFVGYGISKKPTVPPSGPQKRIWLSRSASSRSEKASTTWWSIPRFRPCKPKRVTRRRATGVALPCIANHSYTTAFLRGVQEEHSPMRACQTAGSCTRRRSVRQATLGPGSARSNLLGGRTAPILQG